MSQPALASFDPLATHPFTNNSGLLPKPAQPSQFPHPLPSAMNASNATAVKTVQAPQPQRAAQRAKATKKTGAQQPVFVPFRPERSSPELDDILLRKKFSDIFANKQTWSIDQTVVPLPPQQASRS